MPPPLQPHAPPASAGDPARPHDPQPPAPTSAPTELEIAPVRAAISHSLPFLEAEGSAWMRGELAIQGGRACVSCHHVNYAVWSLEEAHRIGLDLPGDARRRLTADAAAFVSHPDTARSMSIGPMLLGLEHDPGSLTETLLSLQTSSGRWRARGQFPDQRRPVAESDAVATIWSILVLPRGAGADAAAEEAAIAWLESSEEGASSEWLAGRLLLAERLQTEERTELLTRLFKTQNADGGWGFLADDPSNAFSTGQALYALAEVGEPADAAALRFLVENQQSDGSWLVPSAAFSASPNEERDEIYRYWGTAWATIGLARSLRGAEPELTPRKAPEVSSSAHLAASRPRSRPLAAGD